MVKFGNLKLLAEDMERNGMPSACFGIVYNGHTFSCVFINEFQRPLLLITSLEENPFTIRMEGNDDFFFDVYLGDNYRNLVRYLELKYDPEHKFSTQAFFQEFDGKIPNSQSMVRKPSASEMARSINYAIGTLDDEDKIYFYGWKNLPAGQNVSETNYYQSCGLVGYEMAQRLRESRISSCWSNEPAKENLGRMKMYLDFF